MEKNKQTFAQKVYKKLRQVPRGKVTTYKDLAHAIGSRAYRAVGTAMKNNPDIPKTPCHRVVNSDGRVGQYAAVGGQKAKTQMLQGEGIKIKDYKVQDFKKVLHQF